MTIAADFFHFIEKFERHGGFFQLANALLVSAKSVPAMNQRNGRCPRFKFNAQSTAESPPPTMSTRLPSYFEMSGTKYERPLPSKASVPGAGMRLGQSADADRDEMTRLR